MVTAGGWLACHWLRRAAMADRSEWDRLLLVAGRVWESQECPDPGEERNSLI